MSLLWTLLVLVAALAVVAPLTRVLGRNTGWPLAGLYLASWVAFLPAIREVLGGGETTWSVPWVPELGVDLAFRADGLGVVFGSIALLIGAVVLVYATRYLEPDGSSASTWSWPCSPCRWWAWCWRTT